MDRATWLQVTFGMGLVGVNLLPGGADPDGPGLTYLDPEDPARTPQRIPWPPSPGEAGVISRGRFGSAGWIALWTTVGDRGHRYPTVAVSAAGDYVVVADEHGAELELHSAPEKKGCQASRPVGDLSQPVCDVAGDARTVSA